MGNEPTDNSLKDVHLQHLECCQTEIKKHENRKKHQLKTHKKNLKEYLSENVTEFCL